MVPHCPTAGTVFTFPNFLGLGNLIFTIPDIWGSLAYGMKSKLSARCCGHWSSHPCQPAQLGVTHGHTHTHSCTYKGTHMHICKHNTRTCTTHIPYAPAARDYLPSPRAQHTQPTSPSWFTGSPLPRQPLPLATWRACPQLRCPSSLKAPWHRGSLARGGLLLKPQAEGPHRPDP